jgi:hypothetical protein
MIDVLSTASFLNDWNLHCGTTNISISSPETHRPTPEKCELRHGQVCCAGATLRQVSEVYSQRFPPGTLARPPRRVFLCPGRAVLYALARPRLRRRRRI